MILKKLSTVVLTVLMVGSMCISSFATNYNAKGFICSCGGNMLPQTMSTTPWIKMSRGVCEHGNIDHSCFVYGRTVNISWNCTECSASIPDSREEFKKVCE